MKKCIALLSMMGVVFGATAMENDNRMLSGNIPFANGRDLSLHISSHPDQEILWVNCTTGDMAQLIVENSSMQAYPITHDDKDKLIKNLKDTCYRTSLTNILKPFLKNQQPPPLPTHNNLLNSTGGKIMVPTGVLFALYGVFHGVLQTKEYWHKLLPLSIRLPQRTKKRKKGKKNNIALSE